jgi:hypothetical protein
MTKLKVSHAAFLLVSGCASTPTDPSIPVVPEPADAPLSGKPANR